MSALRVALVCPYSLSIFGGVQGQVLGLARALRRLGAETRVIAPCDGPPPETGVTTVGPTRRFPTNGSIAPITSNHLAAARTLEALRGFAPDVVHLHEPLTPGPTHAALVGTDIPSVGTFHASYHAGYNKWYVALRRPLQRMVNRLAVCVAVSDEATRDVEAFGVQCEVLFNGVEVDFYRATPPTVSERPAILFVGRHEPRKGLAVLLDAFEGLDRDAVLWVASTGPQTASLQARGVPDVEWLGRVSETEKAARLRGATIACAPSIEGESFGVVLLEAMASGTSVIASDLTGYRAVARGDNEARLVPPGDAAALRGALQDLLDDSGERDRFAKAGSDRAEEFSIDHLAELYIPIYERAIRARANREWRRATRSAVALTVFDAGQLACDVAAAVARAVGPELGTVAGRARVSRAPGGDATLAIDEIAESVVETMLADAGDVGFYSEDRGLVVFGRPRCFFVIDPIDGTRPAAAGLESCGVSIGVTPPDEAARLGDVTFGVVHELKTGDRYWAERGGGAHGQRADGAPIVLAPSANVDLEALFWEAGLRGRPSLPMAVVLETLSDDCSMGGGVFSLGSAAFALTRVANGQLDAYVDAGRRVLDTYPELEPEFLRVGEGAVCTNFPYDVAAGALIVEEAGGVVTMADGAPLHDHPAIGSGREEGLAVLASGNSDLHERLLAALGDGLASLGRWLGVRA